MIWIDNWLEIYIREKVVFTYNECVHKDYGFELNILEKTIILSCIIM